jgi:hypothetical protein
MIIILTCTSFRACDNIYRRILDRNKQKYKRVPTMRQLQLIEMYLEGYLSIVQEGTTKFGKNKLRPKQEGTFSVNEGNVVP